MYVVPIPARLAREVAEREHYMHRKPMTRFAYGLYAHDALDVVGIVVFGTPASSHLQRGVFPPDPCRVIELNRLWVHDDLPTNTESWFVARALKALPPMIVVSFADMTYGHHGGVYRALNFRYAGWTDMDRRQPRLDYIPAAPGGHSRDAARNGHTGTSRRGLKVRYWTVTGTPAQRRHLRQGVAWPSLNWDTLPPPASHTQVRDLTPYLIEVA